MCGLFGALYSVRSSDTIREYADSASLKLKHRGPDDKGIWIDKGSKVMLGHTRLSILDLSNHGHQPMHSECGRYTMVYNGEIYNHLQIRDKIKKTKWNGQSDSETLLACISLYGIEKTLNMVVGMFAIAIWDRNNQQMLLMRDRMGEKPLYYGWIGDDFVFSSELKALRSHPDFNNSIDRNVLSLYMKYMYIPAPYSMYQDIYKVEPGCIVRMDHVDFYVPLDGVPSAPYLSRGIHIKRWWSITNIYNDNAVDRKIDIVESMDALESALSESVQSQSIADVPVGAFLSGGVDSSLIVAMMQRQSECSVKTFSIGYEDHKLNEAPYAKKISEHLGTDHHELYVSSSDAMAVIPKLPSIYDEPFADSSQIPTFLVSQLARNRVTVALTGDGGDELFGGYNRYFWRRNIWSKVEWMPYLLRKVMGRGVSSMSVKRLNYVHKQLSQLFFKNVDPLFGDKVHKFAARLKTVRDLDELYMSLVSECLLTDNLVLDSTGYELFYDNSVNLINLSEHESRMMYCDLMSYLPDDILCKVDRAAMSVGLESRMPMLDHRVLDIACRLPLDMKIHNGQGKWILRQILYKYVPRALIDRPKAGFGVPVGEWIRGPLRIWADNLLNSERLESDGYFDARLVDKKWKEHLSGKRDWTNILWAVLMFNVWVDENY